MAHHVSTQKNALRYTIKLRFVLMNEHTHHRLLPTNNFLFLQEHRQAKLDKQSLPSL